MRWWQKNFPMSEGQRNHKCLHTCYGINDYGISKTLASFCCNQHASSDFSKAEIEKTINSAYSNTQNFGTKFYEDTENL